MSEKLNMMSVTDDLKKRQLRLAAVICEDTDGNIQVLGYEGEGLVNFISRPVETLVLNEKLDGNMIRSIAEMRCSPIDKD